jgi:hypothetical protein
MATVKKTIRKAQVGRQLTEIKKDNTRSVKVNPSYKKSNSGDLNNAELSALAHQARGMGRDFISTFVKKAGSIQNETGTLKSAQKKQLDTYMNKAGTAKKIYEGLPNVGRMLGHGNSAADIPKGSQLEKQRKGGSTPKAKDGKWIQKVSKSIKARGTEGKCTPITKPGCTGRAKALAKTFKKIAAKRKAK